MLEAKVGYSVIQTSLLFALLAKYYQTHATLTKFKATLKLKTVVS
jgi:hypothetical protein